MIDNKNYNPLEEEWILVLYGNSTFRRVGIKIALKEAGRIRFIAATNPMDRVAAIPLPFHHLIFTVQPSSQEYLVVMPTKMAT
jgi:hypothetical protein